ncbi:MAG: hypothetical protein R3F62_00180 [Planctomycetota bacterium]
MSPARRKQAVQHEVQVLGTRGNRYTVEVLASGKARCPCKGFRYRHECRHVLDPEVRELCARYAPPRHPREQVLALASCIAVALRPYVTAVEIVGSLRRNVAEVKDVDLIFVPGGWAPEQVVTLFRTFGQPLHYGESFGAIVLPQGIGAQLWCVEDPAVWGAALLHFTGPRDYNIGLRIRANKRGWHLSQHGLVERATGRLIAGATEEEVVQALGLPWIPPAQRGRARG